MKHVCICGQQDPPDAPPPREDAALPTVPDEHQRGLALGLAVLDLHRVGALVVRGELVHHHLDDARGLVALHPVGLGAGRGRAHREAPWSTRLSPGAAASPQVWCHPHPPGGPVPKPGTPMPMGTEAPVGCLPAVGAGGGGLWHPDSGRERLAPPDTHPTYDNETLCPHSIPNAVLGSRGPGAPGPCRACRRPGAEAPCQEQVFPEEAAGGWSVCTASVSGSLRPGTRPPAWHLTPGGLTETGHRRLPLRPAAPPFSPLRRAPRATSLGVPAKDAGVPQSRRPLDADSPALSGRSLSSSTFSCRSFPN